LCHISLFTRKKYARSNPISLEYVKISYVYCRILDWYKDDSQIRSYVASSRSDEYNPRQKVQAAQKTKNGVDLLEEFDKGMKVIESWKVGDEAE
jgi:tRNA (Thr-GGU) A37 N-methylase